MIRTSGSHPIRVDPVDLTQAPGLAGATGSLGMTFLPGKQDMGFAGEHRRTLAADAARLREHWKTDVLVVLVEDHELASLVPGDFPKAMANAGVELIRFPIEDQGVPTDLDAFRDLLGAITARIRAGQHVVVACRGGLGRTGTVVACVLRDGGLDGLAAVTLTRKSRPRTIESAAQERFVLSWEGVS